MPVEGRHAPASPRRTPLIVAGVVALVVVVGLGAIVLSGGGDGIIPGVGDRPPVPRFSFKVSKPTIETTAQIDPEATVNEAAARAAAKPAAEQVAARLHDLYVAAFLDPANWTENDYGSVDGFFDGSAQAAVRSQSKALTAGDGVSELDSIVPLDSTLRLEVLLDPDGVPVTVSGAVNFQAKGVDGGSTYIFRSKGQYVFRKVAGSWKIVSFSVRRADTEKAKPASTTPTGEPS